MRRLISSFLVVFLILAFLLGKAILSPKASNVVRNIPQYPNSTFLSTFQTSWPDDYSSDGITYATDDDPAEVLDFYRRTLPEQGWVLEKETEAVSSQSRGSLWFTKKRCTLCIWKKWRLFINVSRPGSFNEDGEKHVTVQLRKE